MRIDVHGHLGTFGDVAYSVAHLKEHAARCGLDAVFVSNISAASRTVGGEDQHEPDANYACLDTCDKYAQFAPLYWVRPGGPDCNLAAFAGALVSGSFGGAFLSPGLNDFDISSDLLEEHLRVAARLDVPVMIEVGEGDRSSPIQIYATARRHPRVAFILVGGLRSARLGDTTNVISRAAEREDARLFADTTDAAPADTVSAIARVGADKVLFGTGGGANRPGEIEHAMQMLTTLEEKLSRNDFAAVVGDNAARIFQVNAPTRT